MSARSRLLGAAMVLAGSAFVASGCAGAATGGVRTVNDAETMRAGLATKDTATLAPQPFAAANQELELAKRAQTDGDDAGADLHAERALAYYNDAIVVARLARATKDDTSANDALARASTEAAQLGAQRKAVDHETDDLEKKLRVAREAQLPLSSGAADPERDRARAVAAQALVTQARLLCSAARLVSPQAPGLGDAESAVATLEKQVDGQKAPLAIDPAARARAACLASLTKARRAAGADPSDGSDLLLAELSQSGDPKNPKNAADFAPGRDERGVVVTLRSAFKGDQLAPESAASLKDLGRVAAAHPTFAVQVVLHDAAPPNASESAMNTKRGESVAAALAAGGATAAKIKVEQAGARAPIVDPKDTRHRERNARLEVVFVGS